MKKKFMILALGLLLAPFAQAHFLFEPFVGYSVGSQVSRDLAGTETKSDLGAGVGGLRLAWVTPLRLWIGVEGETTFSGKGKTKDVAAGTDPDYDFTGTTGYVSLGYETMMRVRLYGAYALYDSHMEKESVSTAMGDTTVSGGTAFKVGLGYHLTQHIAINFEYAMHDYKKMKNNLFDNVDLKDAGVQSQKVSAYGVNFSLPFFW